MLPRTLTSRLIVTTILLVAVVSALVCVVTALELRRVLVARLDDQVVQAAQRRDDGPPTPFFHNPCAVTLPLDGRGYVVGQSTGTILGTVSNTCRTAAIVTANSQVRLLDRADVATLAQLSPSPSAQTVSLTVGPYRVIMWPRGASSVTGLPMSDVNGTVNSLVEWEAAVALGCVALAALIGQAVVRRQLSPLRRVAAAATNVTRLPLSSGEVGVIERVPAELTDPETEVGQVGAAFNAMLGHVEAALDTRHESEQRVRRFVADASHELRTPLSTVMGYAELTRRSGADEQAMRHAMGRIQSESGRMAALVEDLLLLARLDSGRPLEREDVDVSLLLAEAVNDARVVSPDHTWRLTLPPQGLRLTGDRDRLHQVVSNLLTNAIRHTPPGTTVSVAADSGRPFGECPPGIIINVHDDGPGVPPSLAGKEFERFSRAEASRARDSGGAGLGLSIVQAIVGAHGGTVEMHSVPGDTTVSLWLPLAAPLVQPPT